MMELIKGIKKYKKEILFTIIFSILILLVVYLFFLFDGYIPTGDNLNKSDWLAFFGSYLSFLGTVFVSIVALRQSRNFFNSERSKEKNERKRDVQPIFSIEIVEIDKQIPGTATPISEIPSKNFRLKIENVSSYPILHVWLYTTPLCQLLKCGDKIDVNVKYTTEPKELSKDKKIVYILEEEYEKAKNGLSKGLTISYEDIDGNGISQEFELREIEGYNFYSKVGTCEVY